MAKKGKLSQRVRDFMVEYAYLVTLGCVLAVVVSSALYTRGVQARSREAGVQAAAQAAEIEEASATEAPQVTPLPTIAPLQVRLTQMEAGALWPLGGEVIRPHELLTPVYWEMLGVFKTHAGVDIAGEEGSPVLCAADGTVVRTERDELWGWQATVLLEDGHEVCYRGLEGCAVRQGERVRRGESIGTLLKSIPCEAEMGTHLHMEARKGELQQDPLAMLEER